MNLEFFIALRYLKARRNGVFTFITSIISVGGITLGVGALIVTLSVMSGFHKDIKDRILGLQPHIIILKDGKITENEYTVLESKLYKNSGVRAVAPFSFNQSVLRSKRGSMGVLVKAIDWKKENKLVSLNGLLVNGKIENIKEDEIILGDQLAKKLYVSKGDEILMMTSFAFAQVPKMKKYKVEGIFHCGMYEYDSSLAYISISSAKKAFGMDGSYTALGVSVFNADSTAATAGIISEDLFYPYSVNTWETMNRNLFAALKLEKIMMFIILALIIIVAAFNIISNLLLLTVEKSKEIGIFSALGMRRLSIAKVFFCEGIIMGISGIFLGTVFGSAISLLLKKYRFIDLPRDIYYLDTLPVRLVPQDIIIVILSAVFITLAASIYPAYQASKLDPLEAIRYG